MYTSHFPDPTCTGTTRGSARLVGGTSLSIGKLELCNTAGFRRGVCDNGWDDNDARVVCRELGQLQDGVGVYCIRVDLWCAIYLDLLLIGRCMHLDNQSELHIDKLNEKICMHLFMYLCTFDTDHTYAANDPVQSWACFTHPQYRSFSIMIFIELWYCSSTHKHTHTVWRKNDMR